MRLLFSISLLLLIASCRSPQELYQNGLEKIEKAIEQDSTLAFPTDTIRTIDVQVIPGVDGKDSIIHTTETIEIPCDFDLEAFKESTRNKTRRELRFERRMYKDSLKHQEKMYKLETKRLEDSLAFQKKLNKELTKRLKDEGKKDAKISKHENKSSPFLRFVGRIWWLILIIGIAIGFYISRWIPKIPNPFKQKQDG